ncbi:CPBP family intramembrane glutamic endopeptidase [Staphylococcus pseudoxylosus]|uniref:CPBP family intramembrane glutamic endopeptidase n=2 Tax=Staphylococcus TaxID=1279 RepID=UPI002DBB3122|nr:type II CAAX endopeptidase family protein [Staphylococcus pseudoxylosus]MEB5784501.1 CPBP family intramembrane metalloprotease [Staphylococcus pseudoxylosus]
MNSLMSKYPFTFFLLFAFVIISILRFIGSNLFFSEEWNTIITESILIVLLLIFISYTKSFSIFQFDFKSFFSGLAYGWYPIIIALFMLITHINKFDEITLFTLFLLIISNFLVGAFEEIFCRGIIFKNLLNYYSPIKSGILSALIFSLAHIVNFFSDSEPFEVISQILYAFFLGILFAAIYYKTKNIWTVILLHAFIDFSASLIEIPDSNVSEAAVKFSQLDSIIVAITNILIVLPALLIGLYYFKKFKPLRPNKSLK